MANDWERLRTLMNDLDNEQEELRADKDRLAAEMRRGLAIIAKEQKKIALIETAHASVTAGLAVVELRKQAVVEPRKRALSLDKDDLASDANIAGRASESNYQRAEKRVARHDPVSEEASVKTEPENEHGGAVATSQRKSGRLSKREPQRPTGAHLSQAPNSTGLYKDCRTSDTRHASDTKPLFPPHIQLSRTRGRSSGSGPFVFRRPTGENAWWSISAARWETASLDSQRRYTHVGNAQDLGMLRPGGACTRCIAKGAAAATTCRVSGDRAGGECGRCIFDKKQHRCE